MAKPTNGRKGAKSTKRANLVTSSSVVLLAEQDLPQQESSLGRGTVRVRESILKIPRHKLDQTVISKGNIAAHVANAVADMALYHGGYLAGNDVLKASFEDFYANAKSDAEEWNAWPEAIRKDWNYSRTLHAMTKLGWGLGSEAKVTQHNELVKKIFDSCLDASTGNLIPGHDNNTDVVGWLAELDLLTAEIVEMERKKLNNSSGRLAARGHRDNSAEDVQQANVGLGGEQSGEGDTQDTGHTGLGWDTDPPGGWSNTWRRPQPGESW
jgi:hypothetical protein